MSWLFASHAEFKFKRKLSLGFQNVRFNKRLQLQENKTTQWEFASLRGLVNIFTNAEFSAGLPSLQNRSKTRTESRDFHQPSSQVSTQRVTTVDSRVGNDGARSGVYFAAEHEQIWRTKKQGNIANVTGSSSNHQKDAEAKLIHCNRDICTR